MDSAAALPEPLIFQRSFYAIIIWVSNCFVKFYAIFFPNQYILTAMPSFHLYHKFYIFPQCISRRITHSQKNLSFYNSGIVYCSQAAFNSHFSFIYYIYYRNKRGIFLKKEPLCTLNDNWGCIIKCVKDGYLTKNPSWLHPYNLIFRNTKHFLVFFLRKVTILSDNACSK
jgi:hypothetical protein